MIDLLSVGGYLIKEAWFEYQKILVRMLGLVTVRRRVKQQLVSHIHNEGDSHCECELKQWVGTECRRIQQDTERRVATRISPPR